VPSLQGMQHRFLAANEATRTVLLVVRMPRQFYR
jgi:hypothetical protein